MDCWTNWQRVWEHNTFRYSCIFVVVWFLICAICAICILHVYKSQKPILYDENTLLNVSQKQNQDRDNNNKYYSYGHYSMITSRTPNMFKYPLYYFSHPVEYTIKAGQCLYIPKNWWHWVVSFANKKQCCIACNHWFDKSINNSLPYVDRFIDNKKMLRTVVGKFKKKIKRKKFKLKLWHESDVAKYASIDEFLTNKDRYNDCYMITLKSYLNQNKDDSTRFFENFKQKIPLPYPIQNVKIHETNFWLNHGNIDTGLHYDDHDGILCVLSGTKVVTLFPPSDSKFLYPIKSK